MVRTGVGVGVGVGAGVVSELEFGVGVRVRIGVGVGVMAEVIVQFSKRREKLEFRLANRLSINLFFWGFE